MKDTFLRLFKKIEPYTYIFGIFLFFVFAVSTLFFSVAQTVTAPPNIITYQGKLLEGGLAVTSTKQMKFVIYDDLSAGTALYTASGTVGTPLAVSITPSSGIFAIDLGDTAYNTLDPQIFAGNSDLFLEVTVGSDILSPRKRLTAAPFAMNARYLNGVGAAVTSTGEYIPISDTNGMFTFMGDPQSSAVDGGTIYINPATADANETLFGIALGGSQRFRVDEDGDVSMLGNVDITGQLAVTGATTLNTTTINDIFTVNATSTFTAPVFVSTTVASGDVFHVRNNGTSQFLIDSNGNIGINTTSPQYRLVVDGSTVINVDNKTYPLDLHYKSDSIFRVGWAGLVEAVDINVSDDVTIDDRLTVSGISSLATTTVTDFTVTGSVTGISVSDLDDGSDLALLSGTQSFTGSNTFTATTTFSSTTIFNATTTFTERVGMFGSISADSVRDSIAHGDGGALLSGPQRVQVVGNYAYVLSNGGVNPTATSTFAIIDVSDPLSLRYIGGISHGDGGADFDDAIDFVVSGHYAYIAGRVNDVMETIDISNPANPQHVSKVYHNASGPLLDKIKAVTQQGKYLYAVSASAKSVEVLDISNPGTPIHAGSFDYTQEPLLTGATDIEVRGKYAYIASAASSAMVILDVSDPTNISSVGTIENGDGGSDLVGADTIRLEGNYAYVGTGSNSLINVIDISNPQLPTFISYFSAGTIDYQVRANRIYEMSLGALPDPLIIISNLNNLNNLDEFGYVVASDFNYLASGVVVEQSAGLQRFDLVGNYMYVTGWKDNSLYVFDISGANIGSAEIGVAEIGSLKVHGDSSFDDGVYINNGLHISNNGLLVGGDIALYTATSSYVATNTLNFSHRALFESGVNSTNTESFIFNTENTLSAGNLISIRNNGTERFVIDESGNVGINTSTPAYGLSVVGTGYVSGEMILANNVYVGNSSEQITTSTFALDGDDMYVHDLLGVGDSLFVENAIHIGTSSLHLSGDVSGGLISMTGGALTLDSSGLLSINTTNNQNVVFGSGNVGINSSSPQYQFAVDGDGYFSGQTTIEDLLYVPGKTSAAEHVTAILDGGASAPYLTGVQDVKVQDNLLYSVSYTENSLEIFNISDPSYPARVGGIVSGSGSTSFATPMALEVAGNYVYIVTDAGNLQVIDISDPSIPAHKGLLDSASFGDLKGIRVRGNYAYIADSVNQKMHVVDVSDPANPILVTSLDLWESAENIEVQGKYAYILTGMGSMAIIDISDPANPAVLCSFMGESEFMGLKSISVRGIYAYVTYTGMAEGAAMAIIDISDPAGFGPNTVGNIKDSDGAAITLDGISGLFVSGDYAYVTAETDDAVVVINIASSTNPTFVDAISVSGDSANLNGPVAITGSGNHLYVASKADNDIEIIDVSGAKIANATIGSAEISRLGVMGQAQFGNGVNIRNGLHIANNGLIVGGDFSLYSNSASATATNTLTFSHNAYFKTNISSSTGPAFIFDTSNGFDTTASTTFLFSVRNNGTSKFSVAGNGDVATVGNFFAASAVMGTPGVPGDLAERVDVDPTEGAEPGDVMIIDPQDVDSYKKSNEAYAQSIAGVVSTQPTIVVGNGKTEFTADMAMVGRVPIKISNENGAVEHGDLLVTASTPGHAMKYDALKDDGTKVVGIIGMALESFDANSSSTGKIMALIKSGWVNNRHQTIAELKQEVLEIAEHDGISLDQSTQEISVAQNDSGQLIAVSQDLNMNGYGIVNVSHITSKDNVWNIDAQGRFITRIATSDGDTDLYALQSQNTEYIFSGSGQLDGGEVRIDFDQVTQDIIDATKSIKVSVTLTDKANGIYVSTKDETGFTVSELLDGTSTSTFDWVVIAERKTDGDIPVEIVDPIIDPQVDPVVEEPVDNPEDSAPVVDVPAEEDPAPVDSEELPAEEPADPISADPVVEEAVDPVVEEPVDNPEDPAPVVDVPAEEDPAPVDSEELPAEEAVDPVVEELAPAQEPAAEPEVVEPPPAPDPAPPAEEPSAPPAESPLAE
ncbi:hypothetical protein KKG22_03920 [Patescibacteria group bacterium]|nr:hypothetical protein [Patescibacteria group bacterium]MBU1721291.1 hypothetical protein [Patescibacteria group bacterium]MBU1901001.1 hypothetical protein [Patescibacteria group bacterium]